MVGVVFSLHGHVTTPWQLTKTASLQCHTCITKPVSLFITSGDMMKCVLLVLFVLLGSCVKCTLSKSSILFQWNHSNVSIRLHEQIWKSIILQLTHCLLTAVVTCSSRADAQSVMHLFPSPVSYLQCYSVVFYSRSLKFEASVRSTEGNNSVESGLTCIKELLSLSIYYSSMFLFNMFY